MNKLGVFLLLCAFSACSYGIGVGTPTAKAQPDKPLWTYDTEAATWYNSAIADDGTIYFSTLKGYLHALTPGGDPKWSIQPINSSLASFSDLTIDAQGTVYAGMVNALFPDSTSKHLFYAINADSSTKWRTETVGGIIGSAVSPDGTIVGSSPAGYIYAFDNEGNILWDYPLEQAKSYTSPPAIGVDGTIYVLQAGSLYAIKADGHLKWRVDAPDVDNYKSYIAIGAHGTLYVSGGGLHAFNPDGVLLWSKMDVEATSAPVVGLDGSLYVNFKDGQLHKLDATGHSLWHYNTGRADTSPLIGNDGTVYLTSGDGHLYAIDANGDLAWDYDSGNSLASSPAMGADGTIYFGGQDNTFYAIQSTSEGMADSPWPKAGQNAKNSGYNAGSDSDGDTVIDAEDNCPYLANPNQLNTDGTDDGGDSCDDDDDNDNIPDDTDSEPTIPADTDNDGVTNDQDADDDNDGIPDTEDEFPLVPADTDGDGITNDIDEDDDNDGVVDTQDAFPLDDTETVDTDGDGIGNNADTDDDNDGFPDSEDPFPLEAQDTDGDGITDFIDTDDDNDGVIDSLDAFVLDAFESIDTDGDGIGNVADPDDDNDGVIDAQDAFPLDSSETRDTDHDGIGDRVDGDVDGDGLPNNWEVSHKFDRRDGSDAMLDTDNDGYHNRREYWLGTNPRDGSAHPANLKGTFMWDKPVAAFFENVAIGPHKTLFGASRDNQITAYNPDGSYKWQFDTSGRIVDHVFAASADMLVAGTTNGGSTYWLYAIDFKGNQLWKIPLPYTPNGLAIGADGVIYLTTLYAHLYAYNPDGTEKWHYEEDLWRVTAPVIAQDGTLYYGGSATFDDKSYITALDSDGNFKWKFDVPGQIQDGLAIGPDGSIAFAEGKQDANGFRPNEDLYVVNPDGTEKWHYDSSNFISGAAIDKQGLTYIVDENHKLLTFDVQGKLLRSWTVAGELGLQTPVLGEDGLLYVSTLDDHIKAVTVNGSVQWQLSMGQDISPQLIMDDDGVIYARAYESRLMAVYSASKGLADASWPMAKGSTALVNRLPSTGFNSDRDQDDIIDAFDNCPDIANFAQLNTDGARDGGDLCDLDDDNDEVIDTQDRFPFDNTEWIDTDGDMQGNNADKDDDNDGVGDIYDAFPLDKNEWLDTDSDGLGNFADDDDDGDGVVDVQDQFPLDSSESVDSDLDGIGNNADLDDDNDGIADVDDAFSLDPTESIDTDGDGIGNNADPDDDGDGIVDGEDAFPLDAQENVDTDGDGIGNNADTDDDNDGVVDIDDAFSLDPTESLDTDGDGVGNNADLDDDGDGVVDSEDAFPLDAQENIDTDGDGIGNNADSDDDNDGIVDTADGFPLDATNPNDMIPWLRFILQREKKDKLADSVKHP